MRRAIPPKGLRDIRTAVGRRRSTDDFASAAESLDSAAHALGDALSGVRVRLGSASRAPAVARPPHTWVFVPKPKFARHQGELLVEQVTDPNIEVQEEHSSVVVLADLPGVSDEEIEIKVHGDVLDLSTRPSSPDIGSGSGRRYKCEVLLPFPVEPTPRRKTMRNGILEVEFLRAPKGDMAKGDMEGGG